jgi:hypothetical protein
VHVVAYPQQVLIVYIFVKIICITITGRDTL